MDLGSWTGVAVREIRQSLQDDSYWSRKLHGAAGPMNVHLAILVEPFLGYLLDGTKTVESRFSTRQCAPFRRVETGDIVLLKSASGPVKGICEVSRTWFFDLRSVPLGDIRTRFGEALCADAAFWKARAHAEYATLLGVKAVRVVPPLVCPKRDRRGWVVLANRRGQVQLPLHA